MTYCRLHTHLTLSIYQVSYFCATPYRDEWLVERNFGRLKGVPLSITPFFVQRDDQVKCLVHLLSLAVRNYTTARVTKKS